MGNLKKKEAPPRRRRPFGEGFQISERLFAAEFGLVRGFPLRPTILGANANVAR
jgi:hypothetical protein